MPLKVCIVNVATGKAYIDGQKRLKESVSAFTNCDTLFFTDKLPPNSPTHKAQPYAFKTYAMLEAKRLGYDIAFWADSSCMIIDDIQKAIDATHSDGFFTGYTGWKVGQWCKDEALETLGITRDEAWDIDMIDTGGFVGYNLNHSITNEILDRMLEKINDGISFPGPWSSKTEFVSEDPKVLGHRHDMTVLSTIVHKMQLKIDNSCWKYIAHNEQHTIHKNAGKEYKKGEHFCILFGPGTNTFKEVVQILGPNWFSESKYKEITCP